LRYAIWAVAALASDDHSHQSSEYYKKARHLTESAALTDPQCRQSAIYRAQAWLHLAMHDIISGRYALSWTNTSHAIRLLQVAKVHNLDSTSANSNTTTPQNVSWSEAEEKRRVFWFAFCLDRIAFIGQGLPSLIDERDVSIFATFSYNSNKKKKLMLVADMPQPTGIGQGIPIFHRGAYYNTFSSYHFRRNANTLSHVRHNRDTLLVQFKTEVSSAARCNLNTRYTCYQRLAKEK
jgi:hypothetical protein